jgi:hypothetical protein
VAADGILTAPAEPAAPAAPAEPTPTPAAPAAPTDWRVGLTGEFEALRAEKSLESFKGNSWDEVGPHLAKAFHETKKMVGAKTEGMVKVPGKDAKPEEIAAYRKALGVPDTPAGYDLSTFGDKVDATRAPEVLAEFHAIGLSQEQAVGLYERMATIEQKWKARANEANLQTLDKLADEWGEHTFNRRAQLAQRLINAKGTPELKAWLKKSGETNNPELFRFISEIAEEYAEDGMIDGSIGSQPSGEGLESKITETRDALAKLERGTPEYKTKLDEYENLLKLRYPEPARR